MRNENSENPRIGAEFQTRVAKILEEHFGVKFIEERKIPIGYPPKEHKFDCVSIDNKIVVECKCYTWTDTGNITSAKLSKLNEAVFYMSFLSKKIKKIIVVSKAYHNRKKETLAEYYFRLYGHLLNDVEIYEIDENNNIKIFNNNSLEFYVFLYNKYFVWKYTAKNRLATTRASLEKYISNSQLDELAVIQHNLFTEESNFL